MVYRKHVALFFSSLKICCVVSALCHQLVLLAKSTCYFLENPAVSIKCYEVVFESPLKTAGYPAGASEKAFDRIRLTFDSGVRPAFVCSAICALGP